MSTTAISSALLGVSQANSTTTTNESSSTDFLTLLLAELENQDPTDPVSTAELTSQMATLSEVEQSIESNEYLSTLVDYASSTNNAGAVSCIGKEVTADTSTIAVSSGTSENIVFTLADDADQVKINISDKDGNIVQTINCSNLSSGTNTVTWDSKNSSGSTVDDGTYSISVAATDADGNSVTASTSITALVTGVTYSGGTAYLITGKGKIALGDVTQINSAT